MNEKSKSLIRHLLTALGSVMLIVGLGKYTGVINYVLENMDAVYTAVATITGVVMGLIGYFKDSDRFVKR